MTRVELFRGLLWADAHFRWMRCIRKNERNPRASAHIPDQSGTEARDASSSHVADAGINYARRSLIQQLSSQSLGVAVTIGAQILLTARIVAQVAKISAEISQEFAVNDRLFLLPVDFVQTL